MAELALFTGYALLALIAVGGAVAAHRAADRAAHHASALQQSRGRLVAVEHSVEAVDTKLRKLAGRVYASERPAKVIEGETLDLDDMPLEEKNRLIRERLRAQHGILKRGNSADTE